MSGWWSRPAVEQAEAVVLVADAEAMPPANPVVCGRIVTLSSLDYAGVRPVSDAPLKTRPSHYVVREIVKVP